MKNTLKLVAALALTGMCYGANAQDTKPATKMEAKTDGTMEAKKVEKTTTKHTKTMHHGTKMHTAKTVTKTKM